MFRDGLSTRGSVTLDFMTGEQAKRTIGSATTIHHISRRKSHEKRVTLKRNNPTGTSIFHQVYHFKVKASTAVLVERPALHTARLCVT